MADVDRLKRRLLSELVQENVDLIQGRRPLRQRRRRDWRRAAAVLAAILAFTSIGLLGASRFVPATASSPRARRAALASRPSPTAAISGLVSAVASAPRLPVPRPIDPAAFPLAVRRIVLDSGHGGEDVGTHTRSGVTEKSLTLDIALRLRRLLERDFQVLMTREADRAVALEDRAAVANRAGADLFVSIHLNWISNPAERGVETYYLGATDDPVLTELAAAENRGSRYSLADMRRHPRPPLRRRPPGQLAASGRGGPDLPLPLPRPGQPRARRPRGQGSPLPRPASRPRCRRSSPRSPPCRTTTRRACCRKTRIANRSLRRSPAASAPMPIPWRGSGVKGISKGIGS